MPVDHPRAGGFSAVEKLHRQHVDTARFPSIAERVLVRA